MAGLAPTPAASAAQQLLLFAEGAPTCRVRALDSATGAVASAASASSCGYGDTPLGPNDSFSSSGGLAVATAGSGSSSLPFFADTDNRCLHSDDAAYAVATAAGGAGAPAGVVDG